ncbi:MAG: alpha/beta fold hydrolase [Candidatus Aminicenantes bacterium]|nr:alpha/beta fold hydrolase [Candidatus Aminicenantes bacterium]
MNDLPKEYTVKELTLKLESSTVLRYTLALPPSSSPDISYPLVLALHYGGQVTPFYGKGFLTNLVLPALRGLNAVMVAPDCPGAGWTDPQSEEAVMELLQAIQNDYPIDSRRIVITGYSMGATGTWDFVFKHPRLFAAAIAVSGMPPRGIVLNDPGTPILAIHSRDDELFPLESLRKFVRASEAQGIAVELRVVAGLSHYHFDRFVPALREAVPWVKKSWRKL